MIASVFGVVMDLQEKVMYIASGQPCENEYTSVKLEA
jgi:hypothetical protein